MITCSKTGVRINVCMLADYQRISAKCLWVYVFKIKPLHVHMHAFTSLRHEDRLNMHNPHPPIQRFSCELVNAYILIELHVHVHV